MASVENTVRLINRLYAEIPTNHAEDIERYIASILNKSGIMYRIFSRIKDKKSIIEKMSKKLETKYIPKGQKMQDLIGIRIVLYYPDDIDIVIRLLSQVFKIADYEHDEPDPELFCPQRINYVFYIPPELQILSEQVLNKCFFDNTFEVQIRSIFSEGWHEIEHDLRYKHKEDWIRSNDLARELNGILASLEICERNIISISDGLAKEGYCNSKWSSMIRNHFRIRFIDEGVSNEINKIIDENNEIADEILRYNRSDLIESLVKTHLPRSYDNVIHIINETTSKNPALIEKESILIKDKIKKIR